MQPLSLSSATLASCLAAAAACFLPTLCATPRQRTGAAEQARHDRELSGQHRGPASSSPVGGPFLPPPPFFLSWGFQIVPFSFPILAAASPTHPGYTLAPDDAPPWRAPDEKNKKN